MAERLDAVYAAADKGAKELQTARAAHRRAVRTALTAIRKSLGSGTLRPLLPSTVSEPEEAFIALHLLALRITEGPTGLNGRDLLALLVESPVDLVQGTRFLDRDAPLRRSGTLVGSDEEDLLDMEFRFGEARYADARRLLRPGATPALPVEAYHDGADHLADWHKLAMLYRLRATLVFGEELMEHLAAFGAETLGDVRHALEQHRERMVARLMATPHRQQLPALRFQRAHGLGELEMVCVTTLLYHPVLAGVATTSAALLAKVVAAREADLLDAVGLVVPGAPLLDQGVVLEETDGEPLAGRAATAELALSREAVNALCAGHRRAPGARLRDRERFLDTLDNSDQFFRRLGLGDEPGRAGDPTPESQGGTGHDPRR
ncbi:MAG: hypothetical protein ACYTGX_16160 [Planctomycetota bacterium]